MKVRKLLSGVAVLALLVGVLAAITIVAPVAGAKAPKAFVRTIHLRGTTTPRAAKVGRVPAKGFEQPELAPQVREGDSKVNISHSRRPGPKLASTLVPAVASTPVAGSNPTQLQSFQGLNHFNQRFANGGNQFSLEPPDQGLCAGNGFVLETTNDVLRVFDGSGAPVTGVVDLNTFFGYAAQFNRTTFQQGPFVTDPSCLFDPTSRHWYINVLTLDVDPDTGAFLGPNHLDFAVSKTSDPTDGYNLYSIPVQDDGTQGTPNHHCLGPGDQGEGPCIGDFPHIGLDKNGFYITTNEYSFLSDTSPFVAAQIYATDKTALAAGAATIQVVQIESPSVPELGQPSFTLWPANVPGGRYANVQNGTIYFLSSNAAEETGDADGFSSTIIAWALTNTATLRTGSPSLLLIHRVVNTEAYGVPPKSVQKASDDIPLGECLNLDCFGFGPPPTTQVEGPTDSSDSRMLQTWFAKNKIFGALDTIVNVGGEDRAGIAWFIFFPRFTASGLKVTLSLQGYLANENNNVTYPAIATSANGTGYMAFTLVGEDHFPSAAYASIDHAAGVGDIHIASEGVGPQDGFTEYFIGGGRPRWGDYGAATLDDAGNVWLASESIEQTCTLDTYLSGTSCGGTRSALANWATRLTQLSRP